MPPQRRRRWLVLGIVLVLHVLFALLTWHEMHWLRPSEPTPVRTGALLVRLIPRPARVAAAPPVEVPPPPPPLAPKPPPVHEAPSKNAMSVSLPATAPAPAVSVASAPPLFDAQGQPLLSSTPPATPEQPGYVSHGPQGDTKLMQHSTPVPYKATRFEKDWSQGGGSSVDDALKRAVDSSTVKHTFHVAPGVRIHCSVSLLALGGGCGGDPPPPPSSKSGDMRLNMAPANALVPDVNSPKAPSVEECIALYRADKPLPQGCPVDTPTRSVDAEMQERAHRQGAQGGG
nr:hypothetical protein [Dyella sp. ASV21]